ncbi:RagB/SusD family nutrient uptake outer membrane protein [Chitinophaga sancti]|uniref:RagB/SusD family nutrient uptake outer membrane protein n=1 Tax=Chitinophaga sancti TaxID=1004 RepID=A0A1K1S4C5_9BACT|nr:RagB/SusD family nutrient uptake outer membrane protein [Chitinophaga sancti]WQD63723.1 RagB/SusD family nutrient uptake outer membrane protein [Chitinophaga sancti]WQG90652.1 RagB/SusD family nutrient uptake outer membrane protein [Chitinophaga sancti]SFW79203.1 Starch-binding associating with outer membrane [Chitinophaga sancti]
MNKLTYILLAGVLLASCSKTSLELTNPNQITTETYWKTEDDVKSALAATYALFKNVDGGFWGVRGVELSNGRGDDFFIRNDVPYLYQLSTFTNTPDNSASTNVWNVAYRAIFRANQILVHIDGVSGLSAEAKKAYIAEAKFIRGLNEYVLVINFGDVPLRTTIPASTAEYFVAKSPAADVWAQVIKDFSEAAADLPMSYDNANRGRATKGAALGFLGKSYVYTKDWAKAESTLKQLTTAPFSYQLLANYGDNFTAANDNNAESLFEIQVQDVGGTNPWAGENANEGLGVTTAQEFAPSEASGWFEVAPTDKLFNEFQQEKTTSGDFDSRMYATLFWDYPGAVFYKKPFSAYTLPFGFKSYYKKYQNYNQAEELTGSSGASDDMSDINEKAMRYADVLLLLAESVTMQGRPADAVPYVTAIRNRAGLPALAAGLDQANMMKEIRHQRFLEFAREGQRFYDLQRWGILKNEIANSDKVGKLYFVSPKHEFFPIPQDEINSNPEMIQNSNW